MSVEELASPLKHLLRDRATASRTFRHLLRDLLRETTYLPDPWVRTYYRSYILSRFQSYLHEPAETRAQAEFEASIGRPDERRDEWNRPKQKFIRASARKPDRQIHLLQQGRKELKGLVRANLGHELPLFRVISKAYGRAGERRFRLLANVWKDKIPEDEHELRAIMQAQSGQMFKAADQLLDSSGQSHEGQQALQAENHTAPGQGQPLSQNVIQKLPKKRLRPIPEVPQLPKAITALIEEQIRNARHQRWSGPNAKPRIPELNAYDRPLPMVRKRNIIREWLLDLKNNLLPPLPEAEFVRLRRLVTGDVDGLVTPKRERDMPGTMPLREHGHPFHQPPRRPMGLVHFSSVVSLQDPAVVGFRRLTYHDEDGSTAIEGDDSSLEDLSSSSPLPLNPETVGRNLESTKGSHYLKPSYLRRLYARMLDKTCMLQDGGGRPIITWGREEPEWRRMLAGEQTARVVAADAAQGRSRNPERQSLESADTYEPAKADNCSSDSEATLAPSDAWMFRSLQDEDRVTAAPASRSKSL